ncbi:MAG: glycosyltransferase family A protein [Leeuwenhoekiella sp.]|uniref:glycosyltransferase family 2 protein n=1 Tax=Leeuwenhoekiella TaxID=283735 RepID=UPI000C4FF309|nr:MULTISPECIES: glycosyltransferase family A protein [Leeuwenhoekiella]MAO44655.1 glycosyl transferase [Leeuwenhoekiella sp.]MBQ53202.1 glycosyl transferase [Leeuwenhoekiella sp.]HCW64212.1 glycosyltransferase family 2 protein [Leeuwenhoekiella sp.]|tara:strand:- start:6307 stop:7143 length:837 start_codon:yes stop_codon:yes gene_type:complete
MIASISDITVVIPCYNDRNFIKSAVDSLLHQTLIPDEIIIVDDGSDQATLEILSQFNNPRVNVVYQENQGVSVARNNGIIQSQFQYICVLDADDYLETTFLEKAKQLLESNRDAIYVSSYYRKFNNKNKTIGVIRPTGGLVAGFLVKNNGASCGLFKKSDWHTVGGYDKLFKNGYEDWDFSISLLKSGKRMYIIPEILFNYRVKKRSRDQNALDFYDRQLRMQLLEKHKDLFQKHYYSVISQYVYSNSILRKELRKFEVKRYIGIRWLFKRLNRWFRK